MKTRRLTIFILAVCLLFMTQFSTATQVESDFVCKDITDLTAVTAPIMDPGSEQLSAINWIKGNNYKYTKNPAIDGNNTQVKNYLGTETHQLARNECLFNYCQTDLSVLTVSATGDEVLSNLKCPLRTISNIVVLS